MTMEEARGRPENDARARVLLVDDQPIVGEAVRRMLAADPSIDLEYCRDAAKAVTVARLLGPTVILQDLVMPGASGLSLLAAYRADPATADIPVIVLSSEEDAAVKSEAFAAGANDYLVKLPEAVELVARIRHHSRARVHQLQRDAADRALRASEAQLVAANAELTALNARLDQATRAKSEFLAYMSHEIRTPMNGVIGMTSLLADTALSAAQRDMVETIRRSGESLLVLINDILDLSKVEAGKLELEARAFALAEPFEDVIKLLTPKAAEKGLTLRLEFGASGAGEGGERIGVAPLPNVRGDALRVRQVLVNLVGNAIKFTRRGGVTVTVDVESSSPDCAVVNVAVADTGVGIPADRLPRLFEPFRQADQSTAREFGGTGLGLAISRRLIEAMGGTITVESEAGRGSTFHVRVAFARAAAAADMVPGPAASAPQATPDAAAGVLADRVPLRVLVADDNVVNRKVAAGLLKRLGYAPDVVADGAAVLRAIDAHDYDVVILDVEMPEVDGYEAARRIHARPASRRPRVVAMSANVMARDRERCLAAGMDDFLPKPIDAATLRHVLERCGSR